MSRYLSPSAHIKLLSPPGGYNSPLKKIIKNFLFFTNIGYITHLYFTNVLPIDYKNVPMDILFTEENSLYIFYARAYAYNYIKTNGALAH